MPDPVAAQIRATAPPPTAAVPGPPTPGGPQGVVEIAGAGKAFETSQGSLSALEGIDLSIGAGEFVSLIGPSGCGKSTLLRLIGDLIPASSGTVMINGKAAAQARRGREYGIVFQAPVLMDWRTVERNVELPLEIMGVGRAERQARAATMLALVELGEFGRRYPWQLSGGMQQRVAIARALAYRPELLLMDEPFASVDAQTRFELEDLILRLHHEFSVTVIFVTHDIDEAIYLADRVVVLSAPPGVVSEVVQVGLPRPRDQITTKEDERFARHREHILRLVMSR